MESRKGSTTNGVAVTGPYTWAQIQAVLKRPPLKLNGEMRELQFCEANCGGRFKPTDKVHPANIKVGPKFVPGFAHENCCRRPGVEVRVLPLTTRYQLVAHACGALKRKMPKAFKEGGRRDGPIASEKGTRPSGCKKKPQPIRKRFRVMTAAQKVG